MRNDWAQAVTRFAKIKSDKVIGPDDINLAINSAVTLGFAELYGFATAAKGEAGVQLALAHLRRVLGLQAPAERS